MATTLRTFTVPTKDGRTATIREARATDVPGYLAAVRAVIAEPVRTLIVQEEEVWTETEALEQLVQPWSSDGARLVAVLDHEIVGAITIHRARRRAVRHVAGFGIFLVERARGLGLGRALLETLEIWAHEVGVERIQMEVFAHNTRAKRLYESMGYEVEGLARGQIRFPERTVDEYLMAKAL